MPSKEFHIWALSMRLCHWYESWALAAYTLLKCWLVVVRNMWQQNRHSQGRPHGGTSPGILGLRSLCEGRNITTGFGVIRVMYSYTQWWRAASFTRWHQHKKRGSKEAGAFLPQFSATLSTPFTPSITCLRRFFKSLPQKPTHLLESPLNSLSFHRGRGRRRGCLEQKLRKNSEAN